MQRKTSSLHLFGRIKKSRPCGMSQLSCIFTTGFERNPDEEGRSSQKWFSRRNWTHSSGRTRVRHRWFNQCNRWTKNNSCQFVVLFFQIFRVLSVSSVVTVFSLFRVFRGLFYLPLSLRRSRSSSSCCFFISTLPLLTRRHFPFWSLLSSIPRSTNRDTVLLSTSSSLAASA